MGKMNGETILELKNLSKSFGGVKATKNVSLRVPKGEIRCLIGPNGAGKSTLFKQIIGLIEPDKGEVWFKGENITKLKSFQRISKGISIKFQVASVYEELTLFQNLRIPMQLHVKPEHIKEEMDKLLTRFGLNGLGNPLVKHLSHGQRQWLEIGMALVTNPDLLLLDEPTAGMSPEETKNTAEIIKELAGEGRTIIVVEHDMAFVRELAPKVTVLHFGEVFIEGNLDEIESNSEVRRIYLGNA